MNRNHLRRGARLTALIVAGLASTFQAAAAGAEAPELADVTVYSGGVDFRPNVDFRRATLTVSGNDRVFQQVYEPGETPAIGLLDPDGQLLADGAYTWRLELTPDRETARALRLSAYGNRGEAPAAWHALTGTFAVAGGLIADPGTSEAPRAATAGTRTMGTSTAAGLGAAGPDRVGDDTDAVVGSRIDAEAEMNAAASRRAPAAARVGSLEAGRAAGDDSDANAAVLGRSLETSAVPDNQNSASARGASVPRPRSDGSNGRPRSDG